MEKSEIDYEIVLKFSDFSKVAFFLSDLENWLQYKKQKLVKKENDKRGSQTASFHEKVRAFHHNHPELTYRECLKKIKNNTFI